MQRAKPISPSRRRFLLNSGWMAAGVTVLSSCSPIYSAIPALPSTNDPEQSDAVTWIQILPNGKVRFYCPRMEMGQGASVGLSQVVAEELNIGPGDIECVLPHTNQVPPFKMTVGSQSIMEFFDPVSNAAANLRETLRSMAAEDAKRPLSQITDMSAGFQLPNGQQLTYGTLVKESPLYLTDASSDEREVKRYCITKKNSYHAIGNSWKHHELEAIVTGQPLFARDVSVPEMVYGQVLKPLTYGSQLIEAEVDGAKKMPGVIAVVVDKDTSFVGVITRHPSQLTPALKRIKLRWRHPHRQSQRDLNNLLDVTRVQEIDNFEHTLVSKGDVKPAPSTSTGRVEGLFETSFAAHAAMEPRAAIASEEGENVEIWCGSQDPFFVQRRVAKAIGYPSDSVTVHPQRMGGGFGGRVPCQASEEAAVLSKAVGQPVRVEWDRESEFTHNYFQPKYSHFISAEVNGDGLIDQWRHDFVSSPIITGLVPDNIAWILDKVVADEGTARGGLIPYRIENQCIRYSDIRTSIPIGAWRGLGSAPNTFAVESMMDDLAKKADMDPLELRLKNLDVTQDRLANVLKRVTALANWRRERPANIGLGLACAIYKGETYAAVVAEVEISHAEQAIQVRKIWCVQDSGLVINPDQVENQITGNIAWGCGMVLKEQITFDSGVIGQNNFDTYEILRHNEMPQTHIELVSSTESPTGVGESAFGPVAPAITNAIFSATGKRIRKLPIDLDNLFTGLNR